MKRFLITLTLCLFTLAAGPVKSPIERLLIKTGEFCSAFSINEKKGYWATAAHCVSDGKEILSLGDEPATVVKIDELGDMAVLQGKKAPKLHIAKWEPLVGERSILYGFPGTPDMLAFTGHVAAVNVKPKEDEPPKIAFHEGGGAGVSGGPIMVNGQVVSLAQRLYRFPSIVIVGPTVKELRGFLKGYI